MVDPVKIYRTDAGAVVEQDGAFTLVPERDFDSLIHQDDLSDALARRIRSLKPSPEGARCVAGPLRAPLGTQELWACGVTYKRSREARIEEARDAGGGDFYARVYEADRPELFFKATAERVVGSGGRVRIRRDSTWNVPEPEFAFYMTASGRIVAVTLGNDMSSRSIEGENPLYLPQAKTYDGSAALGPCLLVTQKPLPPDTELSMRVARGGRDAFAGSVRLDQMKRSFEELGSWIRRETTFPRGVFVLTGTGIVPGADFTLKVGDVIHISAEPIGTLTNEVTS
jgi:2-dehydro-3-deoxy-D-arabinonate dehydratase